MYQAVTTPAASTAATAQQCVDCLRRTLTNTTHTTPHAFQCNYMAFAAQRISVVVHIAAAQEIAEALGLSVAADPRE